MAASAAFIIVASLRWAFIIVASLRCAPASAGRKYLLRRLPTVPASLTLAFTAPPHLAKRESGTPVG
jgi:hypothetical protein